MDGSDRFIFCVGANDALDAFLGDCGITAADGFSSGANLTELLLDLQHGVRAAFPIGVGELVVERVGT